MEQEPKGLLVISVPAAQGQGAGKKQWEFLASSGDCTLLPPEYGTHIDIPAPGMHLQQPGPQLSARQFWARGAGGGAGASAAWRRSRRVLCVSLLLTLLVVSWLRAPALWGNDFESEEDDEDEGVVYPLVWSRAYGSPGEGTTRPEERSTSEALLDMDAKRNAARAFVLGRPEGNSSRPGRSLLSALANQRTEIGYQMGLMPCNGMYYIAMRIGRAANVYHLGVDTGGHLSWLLCDANCSGCPVGPHEWYKPESARRVARVDPRCAQVGVDGARIGQKGHSICKYTVGYYDNSTTQGFLVEDVLSHNGKTALNARVTFGCSVQQGGLLARSPALQDGLLALSKSPMAMSSQLTPFLTRSVFGTCMSTSGGGYLYFGGIAPKVLAWTPYNIDAGPSRSYYVVDLASSYYGDFPLFSSFPVYIDSGTALNYLATEQYKLLLSLLRDHVPLERTPEKSEPFPVCWRGPTAFRTMADASKYFKTLKFGFKQNWADPSPFSPYMELGPEGYLKITRSGSVCLAFLEDSSPATMIIGSLGMRGYYIVYDNQRNRLGWARDSCRIPDAKPQAKSIQSQGVGT